MGLDCLGAKPNEAAQLSPLVKKVVGMERRQLSWQRGREN